MLHPRGECVSRRIAIGPAYPLEVRVDISEQRVAPAERDGERARLQGALATTDGQLDRLAQRPTVSTAGRDAI
jgi:phosphoenolpyruvate-protein kinase (PTS system EI component)